jgi:TusA-related sulfurtransferase
MHPDFDINLTGEILPVSLLKCKKALDALKPRELLSVRTDDRVVAENMTKFIRVRQFRIVHQETIGDATIFFITT